MQALKLDTEVFGHSNFKGSNPNIFLPSFLRPALLLSVQVLLLGPIEKDTEVDTEV